MRTISTAIAMSMLAIGAANAQSSASPSTTPAAPSSPPAVTSPPAITPPQASATHDAMSSLKMTEAQAKALEGKSVYSSDNKSVGSVVAIVRDASDKVLGLQADIGGFLGIGASRVELKPDAFSVNGDRIDLKMTADQTKSLKAVAK